MLNVSINLIWRNFLDRGFFVFRWVKKKFLSVHFGHFCSDLKHNFNIWFFRVMSRKFREIPCDRPFSGRTNVFPAILILQMLSPSMNSNFFQKIFGARRARAKLRALEKRASFSSVAKSGRNKKLFCRNVENGKKINIWTDRNFCKILLATRIWYYVKKEGPRWCQHARILQYCMFMLLYVHQSFFEIWRWLIYGKTSIFDGECDETKN